MGRKRHPRTWFYMYANNRHFLRQLNPEAVGAALIMAMDYFVTGEIPEIEDIITKAVFETFREACDESLRDYEVAVEGGKLGPAAKAEKQQQREAKPP